MRPVLFVLCFTVGLTLMIFSGYLPKSAKAENGSKAVLLAGRQAAATAYVEPVQRPVPARARRSGPPLNADPLPEPAPAEPEPASVPADTVGGETVATESVPAAEASEPDATATDEPRPSAERLAAAAEALRGIRDALGAAEDDAPPPEEWPPPAADAGKDRTVWIGWDELALDGSGSAGDELTFEWKQVEGPVTLQVSDSGASKTVATGLPLGPGMSWLPTVYAFDLTVTDARGQRATDRVEYVVLSAPELVIDPPSVRSFKVRDRYLLAHFESWVSGGSAEQFTFEILAPRALSLTKVGGGPYELTRTRANGMRVYEVTLVADAEAATSWVELLVDTDEKIPGVVVLGVSWDGP